MRIGQLCIIKRLSIKNTVTNHQLYYFYKICLILPTNFIPNWFNCLQSQAKKKVFPPGTKWTSLESLNLYFKRLFFFCFYSQSSSKHKRQNFISIKYNAKTVLKKFVAVGRTQNRLYCFWFQQMLHLLEQKV